MKALWPQAKDNTMLESVTSADARLGGKVYALRRVSLERQRARLPGKPKAINSGSGQSPVRQRRKNIVCNSGVCTAQRQRSQCTIRPVEMHVLVRDTQFNRFKHCRNLKYTVIGISK